MAKPSESISSKWVEGAKRECVKCGMKIKNIDRDVGEARTVYPGGKKVIICMTCHLLRAEVKLPS